MGYDTSVTDQTFGEFTTFGDAAGAVMAMLDELHALDAWFITRARLDDWIVTHLHGTAPFAPGTKLPLDATARERILRGAAAKTRAERALEACVEEADRTSADPDHAFIGAPLIVRDELYGVLCGLDSRLISDEVRIDSPSVMTAARLLSTILRRELDAEELLRRAERAEAEALVDELTGLFNRRGWERLVDREEHRSARYAHGATVVMMDVDGLKAVNDQQGHAAGDALLIAVANAIRSVVREHDVAARLGGDEFALLAVEYDDDGRNGLRERLTGAFARDGLTVSVGFAQREYDGGISAAAERADAAMYQCKSARQTR
jgi:diguanylate cyclase (GGDEF)-like protein